MSKLILVKHAKPLVDPSKPSSKWKLADEGRAQSHRLIEPMQSLELSRVISSDEPKASETAAIIASGLRITPSVAAKLHEHDRNNVPHMRTPDFISAIAMFFKQADRLELGSETARAAGDRIEQAIDAVMSDVDEDESAAIVSHGTVIALFAQRRLNQEPFALWRQMATPSYLVIDWEKQEIIDRVDRI